MKRNLFLKIFISYLVIIFFSFLVLNYFVKDEIQKALTGKIEGELLAYTALVDLGSAKAISAQLKQIAGISGARVTLVDAQGRVFADSEKDVVLLENHLNRPEIQEARLRGKGQSVRFSQSLGVDMLYVALPIKTKTQITGYVRLARPLHDVESLVDKVYRKILLAFCIVAILALLVALYISYRLAEPIRMMERFTERLRRDEPSGNIMLHTSDETKKLADNINYLVEELQKKIRLAKEEQSKLMTALTNINEGVLILTPDENIEFISPSLAGILDEQNNDAVGMTLMESFRNVDLEKAFQSFRRTGQAVSSEITLGGLDPVIMSVSISKVLNFPGEEKAMIVFHDVTRLKKLERIRTDFVANVTHEISTPLTAIIGYLETLQAGAIENKEDARRFILIILKQAQRLHRLMEDLMTISKIELGKINFLFEKVDISEILDSVIPLLEDRAAIKKIRIENSVPGRIPQVKADRDRLNQVFLNILDNAVKFTPEGGSVTIGAEEKEGEVLVTITDTGTGIPREEIQRLGERFYRVDKARSSDLGGTGLGLSIVKHVMLAHGGRMEIESALGRGTKVFLYFPLA